MVFFFFWKTTKPHFPLCSLPPSALPPSFSTPFGSALTKLRGLRPLPLNRRLKWFSPALHKVSVSRSMCRGQGWRNKCVSSRLDVCLGSVRGFFFCGSVLIWDGALAEHSSVWSWSVIMYCAYPVPGMGSNSLMYYYNGKSVSCFFSVGRAGKCDCFIVIELLLSYGEWYVLCAPFVRRV